MVAPLTDRDRRLLKYKRLVCLVAWKLAEKWPCTDARDFECYCWTGLWRGLRSFDPAKGKLMAHLWLNCYLAGNDFALRDAKRGLNFAPRALLPGMASLAELGQRPGGVEAAYDWTDGRHEYRPWEEADWRRVLDRLAPRPARAVELRFRYDRSYAEVAAEMGYASAKVASTVVAGAMRKLRKLVRRGVLDP